MRDAGSKMQERVVRPSGILPPALLATDYRLLIPVSYLTSVMLRVKVSVPALKRIR